MKRPCALVALLALCAACGGACGGATKPGASASASAAAPTAAAETTSAELGKKPPAFSLDSVMPGSGKVTMVPGKVMLVQFWATWNGPCKQSFPKLQRLYETYRGKGLELAALSVDDSPNGVAEAARSWTATFPVAWDDGHEVASAWKPSSMPSVYVIDRAGVIRYVQRGWHDGADEVLEREVAKLL